MRFAAILLLLSALPAASAQAPVSPVAVVRGLLETAPSKNGKSTPVAAIPVTLQTKTYISPLVSSGKDGFYYIPNVPPGTYTLKVWVTQKNPLAFTVTVKAPLTDIPPVIVPAGSGH